MRRGKRFGQRSGLSTLTVVGTVVVMAVSAAGMAPASSEPMSAQGSAAANPLTDGPYSPFTSGSQLEVTSIGDGRARVGKPDPFGEVRNPALISVRKLLTQAQLDAAMKRALRQFTFEPKPVPIPDDVLRQIDDVSAIAGAAPIIGRLPVSFNAFEVGKSYREDRKFDSSVWKGANFPYGSDDPAIAKTAQAVFAEISAQPALANRETDLGLIYSAVDAVRSGIGKPAASGVLIKGSDAFAQLGLTPFVRIFATRSEAVDLYERGLIVGVHLDGSGQLDLDESSEWIESDRYQAPQTNRQWAPSLRRDANGRSVTVAVLDSGVDSDNPAFPRGTIVDGACFINCDGAASPGDTVATIAASNPCSLTAAPRCDHGTHVAAIIAGRAAALPGGEQIPAGVAPAARIASYRVGSPNAAGDGVNNNWAAATQALGRATTQAASLDIVAANLSFGTPNRYQVCPAVDAGFTAFNDPSFATAVGVASAAGISVINSNGNGSRFNWGACDPTMIVVANIQKDSTPASTSNFHASQTTLWAPGTDILAASIDDSGNAILERKSGTSMAAPHVAGAVALIDQAVSGYNSAQTSANRVTRAQVQNQMLGIAATDRGRVMIADNRPGTDDQGNTASGSSAPLLSLRNLWMLLAGGPLSEQTTVPTYTPTFNTGVVNGTPSGWTVTQEDVRREFDSGATPFRSDGDLYSSGWWDLSRRGTVAKVGFALSSQTLLDGPYLTIHVKNGTVSSAVDSAGTALPIQRIAKGPQPCTRAGWIETVRIPISVSQAMNRGNGPIVEIVGPDPQAMVLVEGTVASGDRFAVSTDPRPLVFGGSRTFPNSVNLGAHRPGMRTIETSIPWFDLDRISGDLQMIDDSFYAGRYATLGGTRVPNDAVAQDFFNVSQMSPQLIPQASFPSGVIGWNETSGIQDCAVALGHYWWGA